MSKRRALLLAVAAVVFVGRPAAQGPPPPRSPVVVDEVDDGSVAALAGLLAGDEPLGWRLAAPSGAGVDGLATAGDFADPWSIELFALEVAPRALTMLSVRRGNSTLLVQWPARTSRLGMTLGARAGPSQATAPRVSAWLQTKAADALARQRAFDEAGRAYREILAVPAVSGDAALSALVQGRLAALEQRRGRGADALSAADAALAALPPGSSLLRAQALLRRSSVLRTRGAYGDAMQAAEAALAIRHELAPGSWDEAEALVEIGSIELAKRALDAAWIRYESARQLFDRGDAGQLEVARVDYNLALVDFRRGRIPDAERRVRSAVQVTSRLAPQSVEHARNLGMLGTLRSQGGQLPDAARLYEEALAAHRRLDPDGVEEASVTNNLGIVAMQRGRFADAERYYRRSLALKEQLGLSPLDRASTIGNLGLMSIERRDFASARAYLRQGLALVDQSAPGGPEAASAFNNLARVERLAGNVADAEQYAREGLAIRMRIAPNSVLQAFSLSELGRVLEAADRLEAAEEAHRQALAIRQAVAADGTNAADSLDALGRLARRRGDFEQAARLHASAGVIWQRMAPDGIYAAVNLVDQGRVAAAHGRPDQALDAYSRATDILDAQTGSIGASFETQADFRNGLVSYYTEFAELLLARGRINDAFHVAERGRARAFLALMAERDLAFGPGVPKALDENARALTREYDRLQSELGALSPVRDAAGVEERVRRLREIKLDIASIRSEVSRSAPGASVTGASGALGADAARQVLDEDTVALSYLVGEREGHVFVLTPSGLDAFRIPLGRSMLDERVGRLKRLVDRRVDASGDLAALSRELYDALIAPAEAQLTRSRRVVVVPDGPLHALPFAALTRTVGAEAGPPVSQYLVEWRPVFQVSSLTIYARLRTARQARSGPPALLAVGNPLYGPASDAAGGTLSPLPGTRREVEMVGELYGTGAEVLVGTAASEEQVRRRIGDADVVHLAVHGLANEAFPLDSALALTTPASATSGENGLLQGWEIVEQMRLRASLVVLSACDTAGSGEGSGEGLLGLARAFQLAGAPSVVSTLWRVPDEVTPTLMREFHRQVRDGVPFDEALAHAQRAVLRESSTAHPYNWAAFVLNGDTGVSPR